MKKSIPLCILLLYGALVFSQSNLWYVTRGVNGKDDKAWGVDVDLSGDIYWAVEEPSPAYYDIHLFKIDTNAQQIWQSVFQGWIYNELAFIVTVSGDHVYLGGRIDSTNAFNGSGGNALVVSYAIDNGDFNWDYVYDQGYGYEEIDGLDVKPDGIYLTGWTQGQTTDMDFLVQKITFSGQQVWSNSYDYDGLGKFDGANGHMAMDQNFIYAAGHAGRTNIASLDGQMGLVCFSRSNGAEQWNVTWGGALYDDGLGMTMSTDSMLYIVGFTGSFGNGSQFYLNKYSRSGQLQWSRLWGGTGTEDCRAVIADGDSIIFAVGATSSYGHGGKDIFVLKYDTAGALLDSVFWGGMYDEIAHDVAMSGDYLYITGETQSYGNGQISGDHKADGLLLKINGRKMLVPDSTMNDVNENVIRYPEIHAFPNPFILQTTFWSDHCFNDLSLTLFNESGQKVKHIEHLSGQTITLYRDGLPPGVYFLFLTESRKTYPTLKIMIAAD